MRQDIYQSRRTIIQAVVVLACAALLARCFHLQVLDSAYQKQQRYLEAVITHPSRGLIYDRNGKLLVNNHAIYDLMVSYKQVRQLDTAKFCRLLRITPEDFVRNLNKDFKNDKRYSKEKPFEFLKKISAEQYAELQESLYEFPGFYSELRTVRGYECQSAAHLLGYISEVTPRQIEKSQNLYSRGDYIGASGLELFYEPLLRGQRGVRYIFKDNLGRVRGSYQDGENDVPAVSGFDLVTTIDIELQAFAEELMRGKKGAVVAIEPATGEVLAMVSAPSYDPGLLTITRERGREFDMLQKNDTLKPLFNRSLLAKYPPGSIFKPVMALIALQEGVIVPEYGVGCAGGAFFGRLFVGCHGHPHAGNVEQSIQHSCNAYYCQVFRNVIEKYGYSEADKGLELWNRYLDNFGLGRKLGIDLPNEIKGYVPTAKRYNKVYGAGRWYSTNIISLGIGQGELEITPLQMANLAAIFANRGYYYTPHLAKRIKRAPEDLLALYRQAHQTGIDAKHFEPVIRGMELVVLAGTAASSQIPDISMCGKTGTVQNPHGKDHSTFIAFAPKDNPKIAIAVFVENSGWGGSYAAPIASLIIEKYLRGSVLPERQYLIDRMVGSNLIRP